MRALAQRILTVFLLLCMLSACSSISYYTQSVVGHSRLMLARESVESLLAQPDFKYHSQLKLSQQLRRYAQEVLGFDINQSYTSYAELADGFPVWNVVAAGKYSTHVEQWCYLVVGCASYRGYFDRRDALSYAEHLKGHGKDVAVGPVAAYSTLGWFNDPLLPSMFGRDEADFAETLFHEMAHQQLYIKGRSDVNEALASFIGEQATLMWLQENQPHQVRVYQQRRQQREAFTALQLAYKNKLKSLYDSFSEDLVSHQKEKLKQEVIGKFKQEYRRLVVEQWGGENPYQNWVSQDLNNAHFAGVATYRELIDQITQIHNCESTLMSLVNNIKSQSKALKEGNDLRIKKCSAQSS